MCRAYRYNNGPSKLSGTINTLAYTPGSRFRLTSDMLTFLQ